MTSSSSDPAMVSSSSPATAQATRALPYYPLAVIAVSVSIGVLVLAFQYVLGQTSQLYADAFAAENSVALSAGDVFTLSNRLELISGTVNWTCLSATKNGQPFLDLRHGATGCGNSFLQRHRAIRPTSNSAVTIEMTLRLPRPLEAAFAGALILQVLSLVLIVFFVKHAESQRHRDDINRQKEIRLAEEMRARSLAELAADVRHDIRSPLATINHLLELDAAELERNRPQLRRAASRIDDVIRTLQREHGVAKADGSGQRGVYLLSSLLEALVSDKRHEHHAKVGVEIRACLPASTYGLFVDVDLAQLQRALSNLVNNAVQAIETRGWVEVSASAASGGRIALRISDNGKGISPEILNRLGRRGETHGKSGGSGLGLALARATVEEAGGSLDIQSQGVGKGASVTLLLPAAPAPAWFVPQLELHRGDTLVVLDDQTSVHDLWQSRFDETRLAAHGVEVVLLHRVDQARQWLAENAGKAATTTFLVDYELLGQGTTGVDFVRSMQLKERAILVSTRVEEHAVRSECEQLGIRMVPKGLAGVLPIVVVEAPLPRQAVGRPDVILLDDDESQRALWPLAFEKRGYVVRTFSKPAELLAIAADLDKDTWIFVDGELGANEKPGEDFTKDLYERGFKNLVLETGHAGDRKGPPPPWLKAIVGKRSSAALQVFRPKPAQTDLV